MTVQELKRKQLNHIAEIGGYWQLQEADDVHNDLNRDIIEAFRQEHEKAFIGLVNLPDEVLKALRENQTVSIYEECVGQTIYNFGCDFIVPDADAKLGSLIKQWNMDGKDGSLMDKIFDRIEQLGGVNFIWS